jgi:hypothetical protein
MRAFGPTAETACASETLGPLVSFTVPEAHPKKRMKNIEIEGNLFDFNIIYPIR